MEEVLVNNQNIDVKEESDINTFADLKRKTTIVVLGTTAEQNIRRIIPTARIVGYKDYHSAFEAFNKHHYVFKKVATKVRMLGKPVESIKLLDNVEQVSDSETLKLRMEPYRYRKRNGKLYCACPRCGIMQEIAAKCASCGQLM